ncbi:MAG: glycosyltransferase family 2 protein [Myxococcales bacterium]|nr:glycosyltransferase family 2 protein [Myxococcales bacterium]
MSDFRPCILIPTYDNPATIAAVVERAHALLPQVVVVDDGSGSETQEALRALADAGLARVLRRAHNGGKGAAVKDGLRYCSELGYSHALQVDADGQHDLNDAPRFLELGARTPAAAILGQPIFGADAPRGRLLGRKISIFWVWVESFGRLRVDPLCGYRLYPIEAAIAANARGNRMDFDPEVIVRMAWNGVPLQTLSTSVRYVGADEGGVSHFQMLRDNVRISWAHTRLVCEAPFRLVTSGLPALPHEAP